MTHSISSGVAASYKIGVDGGGTKTECILIDDSGEIIARHLAPGCNPSVVGPDQARLIVTDALCGVVQAAFGNQPAPIAATHIYAAGSRAFWRETAATLADFGHIVTADDSHPVLELATRGEPGLVLHGGTGSFVAARGRDRLVHYAGGIGWRFGDPGSGYDLGRRAIARALLELQGWSPPSRLGPTVRDHTGLGETADVAAITRFFYTHPDANRPIAALAPAILRLANEGDFTAHALVAESAGELLALALRVAAKLFPDTALDTVPAGLSGPLLTHPVVVQLLTMQSPLPLAPVEGTPIEGVRRLLLRS
ncbi:MAG: BadF/BadG/BcrA/BcrD ATPase family protein [Opitutaceae bacterium]|nr:BadF/BadG/BcrA/BcrD ATPase family protein [Opitutaceae bacterium]